MSKCLQILILLFTLWTTAFSQNEKLVDINSFDNPLLEELIHQEINRVRDSLKFPILQIDEKLKSAALIQSEYINKIGKLTHEQKKKKFKELRDRTNYVNAVHESIAENIAYINLTTDTISYKQLAVMFIKKWLKSKGHFRNISNDDFYRSGISVIADTKNKKIYAIQVFGSVPIEFDGYTSPALAYNINHIKFRECNACERGIDTLDKLYSDFYPDVEDGSVFLSSRQLQIAQKYFRKKRIYFSVDFILKRQFECGKPNQLHSSPYHDGFLTKPVSFDEMLKRNLDSTYFLSEMMKMPFDFGDEEYEINLIYLKKRFLSSKFSLCHMVYFTPVYGYDLDIMSPAFEVDTLSYMRTVLSNKKMAFKLYFKKDKYTYTEKDIKPMVDSLQLNQFNIKNIYITAYASVEGDSVHNNELQRKRAESIIEVFQKFQLKHINKQISTSENWDEFRRDIAKSKIAYLNGLSKAETKEILKRDSVNIIAEPILKRHRKGIIKIELEEKLNLEKSNEEVIENYKSVLSDTTFPVREKLLRQKHLFKIIFEQQISVGLLLWDTIPFDTKHLDLIYNRLAVLYVKEHYIAPIEYLLALVTMANKRPEIQFMVYNFLIEKWYDEYGSSFYLEYFNQIRLLEMLDWMFKKKIITSGQYYKVMINYHLSASRYFGHINDIKNEKASVHYILAYYNKPTLTEKDAYILSNYLVYHHEIGKGAALLYPFVNMQNCAENSLFYYLSLISFNYSQQLKPDFDEKMKRALERNPKRFCKLFGAPALSFQLMRYEKMKKYYCENCNGNDSDYEYNSITGEITDELKIIEIEEN